MRTKKYAQYDVEVLFEGKWETMVSYQTLDGAKAGRRFYDTEDPDAEATRIKVYEVEEDDELKFAVDRGVRKIISKTLVIVMN